MHLSSKKVVISHKINTLQFEQLLQSIEAKYKQSICNPGETIGAIAA